MPNLQSIPLWTWFIGVWVITERLRFMRTNFVEEKQRNAYGAGGNEVQTLSRGNRTFKAGAQDGSDSAQGKGMSPGKRHTERRWNELQQAAPVGG